MAAGRSTYHETSFAAFSPYLMVLFAVLLLGLFLLLIRKKPDLRTGCLLVLIAFGSMIFINTMRKVFSQVLRANLPPIPPVQDYSNNYVDEQS